MRVLSHYALPLAAVLAVLVLLPGAGCSREPSTDGPVAAPATEAAATAESVETMGHAVNEGARRLHVTQLTEAELESYRSGEWMGAVTEAMAAYGGWDPEAPWSYAVAGDSSLEAEYRKEHGDRGPVKALSVTWDAATGRATVTDPPHPVRG